MITQEDKAVLLHLVNGGQFPGEHAERVVELKAKLQAPDVESAWEHACRNLLPAGEYERVKAAVGCP